jgi:hypothetical protein
MVDFEYLIAAIGGFEDMIHNSQAKTDTNQVKRMPV